MENMFVTEKTLVEIVNQSPESIDILFGIGMHCLGCPASQAESLADACAVHGLEPTPVVEAINQRIAENRR